jgi:trans-2,3-dihydro-3-hydroxyanthranilate isomerase
LPEYRLTWLDVFTDVPLSGNGLAVVHDADGIGDDTMLRFARETRLSETTFVQSATRQGADYRNRIWTMEAELPFAGHPSLGTAVATARARGLSRAAFVQQTPAGLQPVEVQLDGDRARSSMLQEPALFGDEVDGTTAMAAVSLPPDAADPALPAQVLSTGVPHVIAPVRPDALATAVPDDDLVRGLLARVRCVVLYLAACDRDAGTARARGFFAVPGGVTEDPATGSAAGPLCAYLHQRTGQAGVVVEQGIEMGRPSLLEAEMDGDRVRVSGNVVVVAEGTVRL